MWYSGIPALQGREDVNVQGEDDHVVPPSQAHRMVAALEAAGHRPRTLYFANEGHGFRTEQDAATFLSTLGAFLAENLAVGGH
jgi:dipeptidyl aminopeptidase/acylaminoacyl peptidase